MAAGEMAKAMEASHTGSRLGCGVTLQAQERGRESAPGQLLCETAAHRWAPIALPPSDFFENILDLSEIYDKFLTFAKS